MRRDDRSAEHALRTLAPWLAAALVLAVIGFTRGAPAPVGVFYDDGVYLDLALALAGGHGYRHLALPGAPVGVHYPPLYPAWLALWSALRPPVAAWRALAWLKLGNALLAALAIVPWTRWGTKRLHLHPLLAAGCAVASVLLVPARAVTSTLFSEPLAWLLLGLALLAGEALDSPSVESEGADAPPVVTARGGRLPLAAVVIGLLPLSRSILLPFAIAAALLVVARRTWSPARRAALVALLLVPSIAWSVFVSVHAAGIPTAWAGNYGSYTGMWRASWHDAGDLLGLAAHQVVSLWHTARGIWTGPGAVIALAACAAGLWRLARESRLAALGTAGYFAIVLVWPVNPDRFLWGVLPLITIIGVLGVVWGWRAAPRVPLRLATLALALLPAGACTRLNVRGYHNDGWLVPQWGEARLYAPVVAWVRTLPAEAVVLTQNDPLLSIATGRRTAPLLPPDLGAIVDPARAVGATRRVQASLCAAGHGWIAVPDTADAAWYAVRALATSTDSRVRFGPPLSLGASAAAARFECGKTAGHGAEAGLPAPGARGDAAVGHQLSGSGYPRGVESSRRVH
ncbi:MAG TPA: hypothetical protein VF041_17500 [Gemmatimonadaceae bacterium]